MPVTIAFDSFKANMIVSLLLSFITRSGGFGASGICLTSFGEAHSSTFEDMSSSQLSSAISSERVPYWAGTSCMSEAGLEGWPESKSEHPQLGCMHTLTEMAGMLCTTAVLITIGNFWKKSQVKRTSKQDIQVGVPAQTQEQPQVTQAELDWISAARSGSLTLTDAVFAAAMEWWFETPCVRVLDRVASADQELLRPVEKLLRNGRDEEACHLVEQIGRLDKIERELRRSRRTQDATNRDVGSPLSRDLSPLSRGLPDLDTSASLLRSAIVRNGMESVEKQHDRKGVQELKDSVVGVKPPVAARSLKSKVSPRSEAKLVVRTASDDKLYPFSVAKGASRLSPEIRSSRLGRCGFTYGA